MWSKDIESLNHIGNSGQEDAEQSHGMGNPARILNLLLKINCGEKISPNEGRRGLSAGGGRESGLFVPFWAIATSQFQQLMPVMTFRCRMMRSEAMAGRIFPPCKMGLSNFVRAAKYRIRYIMPTKMGAQMGYCGSVAVFMYVYQMDLETRNLASSILSFSLTLP